MFSNRLGKFFIISSVLHIMALSICAALSRPGTAITEPQPIKVGVITEYRDPGVGSGNSANPPAKRAPESEKTEIPNPEKMIVKAVSEKKKEKERLNKREVTSRAKESVKEQRAFELKLNREDEQRSESLSNATAGIDSYKGGIGLAAQGNGLDTKGFGRGMEVGYPDYKLNPKPEYPMIARRNGYEGIALLRVFVLESGRVGKVELEKSSGYGILDKSALDAVKDWIFIPGKRNGAPFSSWVRVPIRFQLNTG